MKNPKVAIIGGGLAGLACATALSQFEIEVSLFESSRQWGGRAGTFRDSTSGEVTDHCQHVAMGCCTQFLDFIERHDLHSKFSRHREIEFRVPGKRPKILRANRFLPAPLHLAPFLFSNHHLACRDRWEIARALLRLARASNESNHSAVGGTFSMRDWLEKNGQSPEAVAYYWQPILVSALGEQLDRVSVSASRHVFVNGFMSTRAAYQLIVPAVSLANIYDAISANLKQRRVKLSRDCRITGISSDQQRFDDDVTATAPWMLQWNGGDMRVDAVVAAVASFQLPALFAEQHQPPEVLAASKIPYAPITSIHLWLDRPFLKRPYAVLPGGLVDWIFTGPPMPEDGKPKNGVTAGRSYYQLVISGSRELRGQSPADLTEAAMSQLRLHWPQVADATVLHSRVITQRRAAMSMQMDIERQRPPQRSTVRGLYFAGDYTRTGWPSTMEGAIRSGYLAAQEVVQDLLGQTKNLLAAEPTPNWLVRHLTK
jgi:squalene-associated FAD-dependent desaturase